MPKPNGSSKITTVAFEFLSTAQEALRRVGRPDTQVELGKVAGSHHNQIGLALRKQGRTGIDLLVQWMAGFRDAGLLDSTLTVGAKGFSIECHFPDGSTPTPPASDEDPGERLARLEAAIRRHRAAQGHDLCWENDIELWSALGDGVQVDRQVPPWPEFMSRCAAYRASFDKPSCRRHVRPEDLLVIERLPEPRGPIFMKPDEDP